jgi:hypothetical protein
VHRRGRHHHDLGIAIEDRHAAASASTSTTCAPLRPLVGRARPHQAHPLRPRGRRPGDGPGCHGEAESFYRLAPTPSSVRIGRRPPPAPRDAGGAGPGAAPGPPAGRPATLLRAADMAARSVTATRLCAAHNTRRSSGPASRPTPSAPRVRARCTSSTPATA